MESVHAVVESVHAVAESVHAVAESVHAVAESAQVAQVATAARYSIKFRGNTMDFLHN